MLRRLPSAVVAAPVGVVSAAAVGGRVASALLCSTSAQWSSVRSAVGPVAPRQTQLASPRRRLVHTRPHLQQSSSSRIELNDALVGSYASRAARPVSLSQMINMGSRPAYLLAAAQWLWQELPVRLAKRLRDLEDLPFGLSKSVEVQQLLALYRESLAQALSIKSPQCTADELAFTQLIKDILTRHQQIVVDLASGINGGFLGTSESLVGGMSSRPAHQHFLLQEFLDRFNSARIGLRMLMAQHVALHTKQVGMVGCIELGCNPVRIVGEVIKDAQAACCTAYGVEFAPRVEVTDVSAKNGGIKGLNYIPAHLRFILFELLKNAMRATISHVRKKKALALGWRSESGLPQPLVELTREELPAIHVVIVDGESDVTIKVSDLGGGIKRSQMPHIFTYTFSAQQNSAIHAAQLQRARQAHEKAEAAAAAAAAAGEDVPPPVLAPSAPAAPPTTSSSHPLSAAPVSFQGDWLTGAHFQPTLNAQLHDFVESFGLPIARLTARHLGGDLQLFSLHGHGTDAFLYINREENFQEVIQD